MRRSIGLAIVTIAALALASVPARAQVPIKFEITPWVGYYVPATDLVDEGVVGPAPVTLNSSLAYGGNLGIRLPMGIGIEAQVGYSPTEVEFDDGSGAGPQTADLDVLFGAANLQWRFGPPLIPVKPYLTAGVGFVRWTPDGGDASTNIAGNLGGGAYVSLGPIVKLRGDARAYITTFSAQDIDPNTADESKFQSHFVLSAGLVFELGG